MQGLAIMITLSVRTVCHQSEPPSGLIALCIFVSVPYRLTCGAVCTKQASGLAFVFLLERVNVLLEPLCLYMHQVRSRAGLLCVAV